MGVGQTCLGGGLTVSKKLLGQKKGYGGSLFLGLEAAANHPWDLRPWAGRLDSRGEMRLPFEWSLS